MRLKEEEHKAPNGRAHEFACLCLCVCVYLSRIHFLWLSKEVKTSGKFEFHQMKWDTRYHILWFCLLCLYFWVTITGAHSSHWSTVIYNKTSWTIWEKETCVAPPTERESQVREFSVYLEGQTSRRSQTKPNQTEPNQMSEDQSCRL